MRHKRSSSASDEWEAAGTASTGATTSGAARSNSEQTRQTSGHREQAMSSPIAGPSWKSAANRPSAGAAGGPSRQKMGDADGHASDIRAQSKSAATSKASSTGGRMESGKGKGKSAGKGKGKDDSEAASSGSKAVKAASGRQSRTPSPEPRVKARLQQDLLDRAVHAIRMDGRMGKSDMALANQLEVMLHSIEAQSEACAYVDRVTAICSNYLEMTEGGGGGADMGRSEHSRLSRETEEAMQRNEPILNAADHEQARVRLDALLAELGQGDL